MTVTVVVEVVADGVDAVTVVVTLVVAVEHVGLGLDTIHLTPFGYRCGLKPGLLAAK